MVSATFDSNELARWELCGKCMSSKYAVEEREQQIAALRELKKLRKRERQGLLPKSLLDSAHDGASFSAEEVRNLSEQEYQNPVISFYMRLNGLKTAPREKAPVRFFRSLKTQAVEHRKDFLDTLTRPQRNLLDYDLKEIELFLENYFVPE